MLRRTFFLKVWPTSVRVCISLYLHLTHDQCFILHCRKWPVRKTAAFHDSSIFKIVQVCKQLIMFSFYWIEYDHLFLNFDGIKFNHHVITYALFFSYTEHFLHITLPKECYPSKKNLVNGLFVI